MSSYTFNITTTEQTIKIKELMGANRILVNNSDPDNGVFYNPNPNGSTCLTSEVSITPDSVSGNKYLYDTSDVSVGDKVKITTVGGVVYIAEVLAAEAGVSFTIKAITGLTPAATDTVVLFCHKLIDGTIIDAGAFDNGLKLKHSSNTSTSELQISFVEITRTGSVATPDFFFR